MNSNRRGFIKKLGLSTLVAIAPSRFIKSGILNAKEMQQVAELKPATKFDWKPDMTNLPMGKAKGIFSGRVVWIHAPGAAHWNGDWKSMESPWWLDENTSQEKVTQMMENAISSLTGKTKFDEAWKALFQYHNKSLGRGSKGYKRGEIIAVKVNMNATGRPVRENNYTDVSPQTIYALIEQLVKYAKVPENNIIVYDAKRYIYSEVLRKVWTDFKDVRFMQEKEFVESQKHPVYGDFSRAEQPDWVKGMEYSNGVNYENAVNIPRQVKEATYLINLAVLKCHSYPYSNMEKGDEGQTAVTMCGKNLFGSIQGPSDLHAVMNTNRDAKKNAYSPLVDLAASPNIGKKTFLYLLDGLYSARKHSSYAVHFPNAPFYNKTYPYTNPEWPSCILASQDGVALDSVGLDILYSQTKNNIDPENEHRPWLLVRENADDYLHEMATPENSPSGCIYRQGGQIVTSLGVHEHWDNDENRRYSRNLDPKNGKGIELAYVKI